MKILFIHGFASSGTYKTADALRLLFKPCEVISPDVPIEPELALPMLQRICFTTQPDLIVGLSLGGFWAQKLVGYKKILINPDLNVSGFLRQKIGVQPYLSPRLSGDVTLTVTPAVCDAYAALEKTEYDRVDAAEQRITVGLFGTHDELIHCHDVFEQHYPQGKAVWFEGGHLPNFGELKAAVVPAAQWLMAQE